MKPEWVRACRANGIALDEAVATVPLPHGRKQRIRLSWTEREVTLISVVAGAAFVTTLEGPDEEAWRRNRGARLATFHVDERGRLVGHAVLPLVGLAGGELALRIQILAEECDRFEHQLTGRDVE